MSISNVSGMGAHPYAYTNSSRKTANSNQAEKVFFRDTVAEKSESTVSQYKRKHPEDVSHVDAQVRAGKSVIAKNGAGNVSREDMAMEEYKSFINGLLNSISFDSTQMYNKEIISISDAGWEQMKNDPDYEAWVLGYTAENRSVRNPFFGWPGASGSVYVEKFGASIEEHIGQSVGISGSGSSSNHVKNEKSWWEKRREKMEELMEEQKKEAVKKAQARRAAAQEHDLQSQMASRQRLQAFLADSIQNGQGGMDAAAFQSADVSALAATAYEENISTFSKGVIERLKI